MNNTLAIQKSKLVEEFDEELNRYLYTKKFKTEICNYINKEVKDKNLKKILKDNIRLMYDAYVNIEIRIFKFRLESDINKYCNSDNTGAFIIIDESKDLATRVNRASKSIIKRAKIKIKNTCKKMKRSHKK